MCMPENLWYKYRNSRKSNSNLSYSHYEYSLSEHIIRKNQAICVICAYYLTFISRLLFLHRVFMVRLPYYLVFNNGGTETISTQWKVFLVGAAVLILHNFSYKAHLYKIAIMAAKRLTMYLGQCLPSNVEGLAKVTVRTLKRDEILNVVSYL